MKPTIRYELKHGDMLMFGDVKCQYVVDLDTEEVKLYVHCEAYLRLVFTSDGVGVGVVIRSIEHMI